MHSSTSPRPIRIIPCVTRLRFHSPPLLFHVRAFSLRTHFLWPAAAPKPDLARTSTYAPGPTFFVSCDLLLSRHFPAVVSCPSAPPDLAALPSFAPAADCRERCIPNLPLLEATTSPLGLNLFTPFRSASHRVLQPRIRFPGSDCSYRPLVSLPLLLALFVTLSPPDLLRSTPIRTACRAP